jgi:hypothetical protein
MRAISFDVIAAARDHGAALASNLWTVATASK